MLLGVGGVRALALCDLPAAMFASAALASVAVAAIELRRARRPVALALDSDGTWRIESPDRAPFVGRLRAAGYRSAMLLVLEFEREDGSIGTPAPGRRTWLERARAMRSRRRRVTVFADSVDARDFSFLHLQLALIGNRDERRR